jgi:hypothetical protein
MPENPVLPKPTQVLGGGSKLPSPNEVFNQRDAYNDVINDYNPEDKINEIANAIPEMPGDHESKNNIYKDILRKGLSPEITTNSLLTLQGKHPHQEGGYKYYINDAGVPVPLKNNERPPQGYEVASIWGSKSDAKDDSPITGLAKTVWNILPSAAENLVDLAQTGYEAVTNESSSALNSLKNSANYLKFEKDADTQKSMLNTDGIDEYSDVLDPKRWDFSPNTLWGTTQSLLGSVGEMFVGGSAAARGIKAAQGVSKLSKPAALAATYAGSFMTNLGEARDAADEAGLTGRDKALFSGLVTAPIAAIDAKFDLGGKILSNKLLQEEKNAFISTIAKDIASKTAEGELTKEALDGLAKATTVGYTQLAKKWSKETLKDVLQQGGEETAQSFMLNAGEQLWDKLTDEEKAKFGTNAVSPKAFAQYLQEGLAGAIGGAPTAFAFNKVKESARKEAQSNTAYGIATKGEEAVNSFKQNVANEVHSGKITPQEGANAIFQVEAYSKYDQQTKGLNITPEEKRRAFDLTFEKANLEQSIPTDYEAEKLNAIDQAKIDVNKKKAKDIQDEINKIILKDDVENSTGTTAEKTKEQVTKDKEKESVLKTKIKVQDSGEGVELDNETPAPKDFKYEVPKQVVEETRTYDDIPNHQWNDPKFNTRVKQAKLADAIDADPAKQTFGVIQEDNQFIDSKGHKVDTFNVTLPDGKSVRFASSMVRKPAKGELGGYRGNTYEENFDNRKNPIGAQVGLKVITLKDSGRKVIFIYNNEPGEKRGKHIGMVKESLRGNSNYTQADLDEMDHLRTTNMAEPTEETSVEQTPNEPTGPVDVKITKPKVILGQPTKENLRTNYINEGIAQLKESGNYNESFEKIYNQHLGEKFDRLNPQLDEQRQTEVQAIGGEESSTGSKEEINGADATSSNEAKTKKVGKKRINQKIKNKARLKAIKHEMFDPYHLVMQHFIGGGKIDRKSIQDLYKGNHTEANVRSHMQLSREKYGPKIAPTIEELAHSLWESNKDKNNADTSDYLNAIESVIQDYTSIVQMAEDLNNIASEEEQKAPFEEELNELHKTAEKEGVSEELDSVQEDLEKLDNDEITSLTEDQESFDKWEEDNDIIRGEGEDVFQKESFTKGDINKIIDKLKKSMPNIKVVYDEKLKAAGKAKGDTITINPYHAGLDTPIHEYGHILIDAIGYKNAVIQKAINQLKGSDLWKETKKRYKELNEEGLGKEVLAEAIGREGAGIFNKEADKSKFKQYLDYIFDWFKTKLGLNKNIAKSLAKQVLSGINAPKEIKDGKEQLQKEKKQQSPEQKQRKAEKKQLRKEQREEISNIMGDETEVKNLPFDKLIELYNHIIGYEKPVQDEHFGDVKTQIAYRLFTDKKNQLEQWMKEGKVTGYSEEAANKSDIKSKDILMKNLSHMTQIVPELQAFSKMFENAYFDMTAERYTLKNELQKLGKQVIKEANKKLGITGRAKELFSSDNAKYFEFVENPNAIIGEDEDGDPIKGAGYWTIEEAKKKGFSDAQINFLKFMHKLRDERNAQLEAMGRDATNEVLKVDKGVAESWRTEGIMQAFSSFLGNGFNLRNVRVDFTDPVTKNKSITTYGDIEKKLLEYGNKGLIEKLHALVLMATYNMKAKRQIQKGINVDEKDNENVLQLRGGAKYGIDPHGALVNKFMKNRSKDRGYSKDFYKAAFEFIDESTHSKHMQELLPYIDSIEYLNKMGLVDDEGNVLHGVKDNVAEWIKQWKDLHLFKVDKPGKLGPEVDAAMKLLRVLTSQLVMAFNVKAGLINIAMGQYNNLRAETAKDLKEGHKRMIKDPKKTADILKKYQVISIDYESNPKLFAGRLFDNLAHGLTRAGEYYIQGSMFMGLMSEKDYDSFEYKKNKEGVEELVLKEGVDEKEVKDRMIKNKNRVSDIQGKYSDKDRRNFMAGEFGKMVGQFKVWVPDWWRERFGEEYITADGHVKKGSYRQFTVDAIKDLRDQVKAEGPSAIWNNKVAMTNLKGALAVATLLSLKMAGDDDDKKRKQGDLLSQMTSNVLFVFDPSGLKFTVSHPVAVLGTLEKFAKVLEGSLKMDAEKTGKDIMKVVPYNKAITQIPDLISGE